MPNLAQIYRPLIFDEVSGQSIIIKELKKRSREKSFPQVMLLSGYTGTGKTTLSRIIAKSILCMEPSRSGDPCNECKSCKAINEESFMMNYKEYNASNLNIESMRALEDTVSKKSMGLATSRKKVLYIDELQELSKSKAAAKNLLKILEKPLTETYFILGTMDIDKIDNAIQNRSVLYKLKLIESNDILDYLVGIATKEKYINENSGENEAKVLNAIANNSNGSLRTAISYLERVIFSDIRNENELISELGLITDVKLIEIINGVLSGNIQVLQNEINNDILELMKLKLSLLYKAKSKIELNPWQKSQLNGINDVSIDNIRFTLENIFELNKFPFLNKSLIEFSLINIINHNNYDEIKRRG